MLGRFVVGRAHGDKFSPVCEKGISVFYTVFTESQLSPFLLPDALPPLSTQSCGGPAHWPVGL